MPRPRCIVAGATGALGRVVAAALAGEGARVGLTYFQGEAVASDLCATLEGAVARRLDLTDTARIPAVLDELSAELGGVDAFVHCAGVFSTTGGAVFDRLGGVTEAGFERLMAVNVRSAFFAVQHLAPRMRGGNVVLVASVDSAKMVPAPVPYAAAGGALSAMTRALAKELGPASGTRVNLVASGVLDGGLSAALPGDLRAQYLKHCGLRRVGRREELASLVAWLAIHNTYVTGQTVSADGGL
jgi:NAD(P)-dependent dehydrogenase (short-subunit alcohol dehydrogenase family)